MPRVYLDNNATTAVDRLVLEEMQPFFLERFGNPSSIHAYGQEARRAVEEARERVASLISCEPPEIVFTSGGTEADNAAVIGAARALGGRGRHIVTCMAEHPAVLRACEFLETQGYEVSYLQPGTDGAISPEAVLTAVRDDTILVSLMAANNETGVLGPIAEVGPKLKERGIVVHTDAVQAIGKVPVHVEDWQVDLLSLSAHKFHGPKGLGALYVRRGTPLAPLLLGGGQERGLRGGTLNTPGIVGLGKAAELAGRYLPEMEGRVRSLRDGLEEGLISRIVDTQRNGHPENRLPHVMNLSFSGVHGEALTISLDLQGVAVSTGAACHSGSVAPSHVLVAMGLPADRVQGALRISLSRLTTPKEIDTALAVIPGVVHRLREAAGVRFF